MTNDQLHERPRRGVRIELMDGKSIAIGAGKRRERLPVFV
jgi:hypothetical protein